MTRRPARDESLIVPPDLPRRGGPDQRVFMTELSSYLNHCTRTLRRIARANGWLHSTNKWPSRRRVYWVTPYAAGRLIAFARAAQGEMYMAGKDFNAWRAHMINRRRKQLADERAKRDAERMREQITLAILGTGTDDPAGGKT